MWPFKSQPPREKQIVYYGNLNITTTNSVEYFKLECDNRNAPKEDQIKSIRKKYDDIVKVIDTTRKGGKFEIDDGEFIYSDQIVKVKITILSMWRYKDEN